MVEQAFIPEKGPVYMDREHEEFDLAMELLCTLPRSPMGVAVCMLQSDLGDKTVRGLIQELREVGFIIGTVTSSFGIDVWVEKEGWAKAQKAGLDYWSKVYGGPDLL